MTAPQRAYIRRYMYIQATVGAALALLTLHWHSTKPLFALVSGVMLLMLLPSLWALTVDSVRGRCTTVSGEISAARRRSLQRGTAGRALAAWRSEVSDRIAPLAPRFVVGGRRISCADAILGRRLRSGAGVECVVARRTRLVIAVIGHEPLADAETRTLVDLAAVPYIGIGSVTYALSKPRRRATEKLGTSAPAQIAATLTGSLLASGDLIGRAATSGSGSRPRGTGSRGGSSPRSGRRALGQHAA